MGGEKEIHNDREGEEYWFYGSARVYPGYLGPCLYIEAKNSMTKHPTGIRHGICNYGNRKVEQTEQNQDEHAKYTSCIELAKGELPQYSPIWPARTGFGL